MTTELLDRQAAFSGVKEVAPTLAMDPERLERELSACVPGFRGPISISQFKGGQSNPTYLIKAASGEYVLRRKPPGKLLPSAHAVDREYRVMKALGAVGFPVPRVHVLCEDEGVAGTAFFLMDKVEGRIVWVAHMPDFDPASRAAVFDDMNATLARLHSYDPNAIGLGDFGKSRAYVARQVHRWSKQYQASATREIPAMDRLIRWLPENLPPDQPGRLVHGDYRLDNMILAPDAPKIAAVLDWELSTLGDPVADFTYHCMQWVMPRSETGAGTGSLVGLDLAELGIPLLQDYVAAYERRTGFEVAPYLDRYFAYNFFRLAAILQGIIGRVRDGTATSPHAPAMAAIMGPLSDTAWHFAERAGA